MFRVTVHYGDGETFVVTFPTADGAERVFPVGSVIRNDHGATLGIVTKLDTREE